MIHVAALVDGRQLSVSRCPNGTGIVHGEASFRRSLALHTKRCPSHLCGTCARMLAAADKRMQRKARKRMRDSWGIYARDRYMLAGALLESSGRAIRAIALEEGRT